MAGHVMENLVSVFIAYFSHITSLKHYATKLLSRGHVETYKAHTVFLRSDAAATIIFAARFVRLFEGSVYFFGKPGDINDGWIRYVHVRERR